MAIRKAACSATSAGISLRALVVINVLAGILLLIFGCVIEFPVTSLPAMSMVILGVFSLFAALMGCVGSFQVRCCFVGFVVLGGLSTLLQTALVISLHVAFDKVYAKLQVNKDGSHFDKDKIRQVLDSARWVLLTFLILEWVGIVLAGLLRFYIPPDPDSIEFVHDPEGLDARDIALARLRTDIEKGNRKSDKSFDKIRGKMAAKYGKFSQGYQWKKKGFFG